MPSSYQFLDATRGKPVAWSWDFGNGQTSALENPPQSYLTPGCYVVRLLASDGRISRLAAKPAFISAGARPALLSTLTAELPCLGGFGTYCTCATGVAVAEAAGALARTYTVPLSVFGVAQTAQYAGGTQVGGWYVGGALFSGQSWVLTVSNPAQTYWLNPGGTVAGIEAWQYTGSIQVATGATVTLAAAGSGTQLSNSGNLTVLGVIGVAQPFAGQFFQVQFGTPT